MGKESSIIVKGSAESVIVGYSDLENNPSSAVLVVGKENDKKQMEVINALQGSDAVALWEMLTIKEDK